MSERDTFDRILALLHEAALDDTRWPAASALIDDAVGAKGNVLVVSAGGEEEPFQLFYAGFLYHGQRHREFEREYFEDFHHRDERIPRYRRQPDSKLVHCRDLYTDEELKHSAAYNDALARGHTQNSINVLLHGPGGSRIGWVINDPIDGDNWSSAQLESIRRLLPHVRQYVNVRQAVAASGSLGRSLDELLLSTGSGVVQLDWRGQISAANARARALLQAADGLYDTGGRLLARWPEDDARLQRVLARALPPSPAQGVSGSTTVRRSKGAGPLVVHVHPVARRNTDFQPWPVRAVVWILDPGAGGRIDPDLVSVALGLSPAQSRVAAMLAEGKTVAEIASATGRKVTTIRAHVRRIFAKHGLNRQAQLVRLVLSAVGPPQTLR